jgi:hypothetical protein
MILEVTAKVNSGLCGHCKRDQDKADFDSIVNGWVQDPNTLPGTNGIPEPDDFALKLAAAQLRKELDPDKDYLMEKTCHQHFDVAHTKWSSLGAASLSQKERVTLAVETFYGEVTNGGLLQYLGNESGAFAQWSVEAFQTIGIPEFADVMREVEKLFPNEVIPEDADERWDLVEVLNEATVEKIEDGFWPRYQSDESEIRKKLYEYLKG